MTRPASMVPACVALLAAVALCAAARAEDGEDPVARWLNEHSMHLMGATAGAMVVAGDDATEDAGGRCLDAMLVSGTASEAVKAVVDQPRPGRPWAHDGFPSSHATVAFAFARAMSDWRPDGSAAFYGFASAVGWARIEGGHHDLSQVMAGAALGLIVGGQSIESGGYVIHAREPAASRPGMRRERVVVDGGPRVGLWSARW